MNDIEMLNNNLLIVPKTNKINLGNGLEVSEQRGKKDLMWGICIAGDAKVLGAEVLYPVYAADQIKGEFAGYGPGLYSIIKTQDVIMIKYEEVAQSN